MHPFFTILGTQIPAYGTMLLLAYFAALIVAILRHKTNGMSPLDVFVAMILAGAGAFLGGKLFAVIQGLPLFFELQATTGLTFYKYFTSQAGMVFYGGFIGCILFILLFCVIYKIPAWKVLDTLLPSLPLAQAIGRVGCFLAGCCYGIPCEHGVYFTNSIVAYIPKDIPLLPVQLIEAACVLGLFIVMVYYGKKARKPGKVLSLYLLGYGVIRFVLEFFRYDAIRGVYGGLSTSQWISILLIALGVYFIRFYKPKEKSPRITR
ncbi:prolipoprotein diacylglyceryl transferase [Christensenellaceae bacterium OttesenSCG-928-K19]|nr:prolipoprotein diacylglyceryl transferase [Christensenellaceae bacterium OttesenSCG-928-K19]